MTTGGPPAGVDYSGVTEVPGNRITQEALSMMYTRYALAAERCAGRDVLEVACGAGQGLGLLARRARRVVGGDVTEALLRTARRHYGPRVPLMRMDAQMLPFRAGAFDVVLLYEAIYYLARPERFVQECRRVLRMPGMLLVGTVNREWRDFNPSPFSRRYLSGAELADLMSAAGFRVELYGGFPAGPRGARDTVVSLIRRTAVALHLIPRTMRGKKWLKRLFLGQLVPVGPELAEGAAERAPLVPLRVGSPEARAYKVLYAVARPR